MTIREGHPGLLPLASPLRREFVAMGGGQHLVSVLEHLEPAYGTKA